jgi:sterol desaturase/sphingolipid hydroxylase (fatty acid hydroxylase superfamily)
MPGNFSEQLLVLISTPIYIIIIGLEILLSNYHHRILYSWKDSIANVYLMLLNGGIDILLRVFYLFILGFFYSHRWITFTHPFAYWLLLLLGEDFLYYWLHRFDHEVRLFWAVHVTHHSSEHMNFTVGFRSSVFQPLYRFIYFIPLAWFGFRPMDILFIYSATQIWGIFVHTELIDKMGWMEYIFVTPSHHRVHHASNPKYLDKNMGMFLIVWDQLFGTFQRELPDESYQPKKYGLTTTVEHKTPVSLIFHEWHTIWKDIRRPDISWQQRWKYIFGRPGWSHDGSRKTSQELRLQEDVGDSPEQTEGIVAALASGYGEGNNPSARRIDLR